MLVSKLHEIFLENDPKQEKVILTGCQKRDGIWDTLGYYNPKSWSINICEKEITDYVEILERKRKRNKIYTRFCLRELVRLHEHAHSLFHTSKFEYIGCDFAMGYQNFPATVEEPLVEFIAWSTVHYIGKEIFLSLFYEVDEDSPSYYKEWNKIQTIIDDNYRREKEAYHRYVPILISVARRGNWNNFSDFLHGIKNEDAFIRGTMKML